MNILIFGGTRFMGSSVVKSLLAEGHTLVCISRKEKVYHKNLKMVIADRNLGLMKLKDKTFDFIFDFIGYEASSVSLAMEKFKNAHYILISSSWVSQYEDNLRTFFSYEQKYIIGKLEAEHVLKKDYDKGYLRNVIRLPITLGEEDHSERFNYYLWRLIDKRPIICVEKNINMTQITYKDDVINAIVNFIKNKNLIKNFIYEGLPRESVSQEVIIENIASAIKVDYKIFSYSEVFLKKKFEEMLVLNPFYREVDYIEKYPNLFEYTNFKCTRYKKWMSDLALTNNNLYLELQMKENHDKKWYLDSFLKKELKICE